MVAQVLMSAREALENVDPEHRGLGAEDPVEDRKARARAVVVNRDVLLEVARELRGPRGDCAGG